MGINADLNLSSTDTITVAMWLKPSLLGGTYPILNDSDSVTSLGWVTYIQPDTAWCAQNRSTSATHERTQCSATGLISVDQWVFLSAVIYPDATLPKTYVNGALTAGASVTTGTPTQLYSSAYNVMIGRRSSGSGNYFLGLVDDVRVYRRELSATEILRLYNNTR